LFIPYSPAPRDSIPDSILPFFPSPSTLIHPIRLPLFFPLPPENSALILFPVQQYLYHVLKDQSSLPEEALAMIRYHSFYPWHREGAYRHLMNEKDYNYLKAVQAFNPYDLYSKSDGSCTPAKLRPYYEGLINKFFPPVLDW
jgi:inositol oxygenase